MPEPNVRAQVWIGGSTLATYRYISDRTGVPLTQLITDTLERCAVFYMRGANAALDGMMRSRKDHPSVQAEAKAVAEGKAK